MPFQVIEMNIDTIGKICRNFPQIARKKISDITLDDLKVLIMVDQCGAVCF